MASREAQAPRFRLTAIAAGLLATLPGVHAVATPAEDARDADIPFCPPQSSAFAPGAAQRKPPDNVRLVTGVPYSAHGVSETVTVLSDGNRIVRHNQVRLWRDSDGRTRTEFLISSVSGPTPLEVNGTVTVIDDPAARARYMLQPGQKVAVTLPIVPCRMAPVEGDADFVGPVRAPGAVSLSPRQKLGERQVGGQTVTGSRIVGTIPAGAIGNEQPIRLTAEQWYAKELQVVVEATYRDPRTGETRYKLRDIERKEPDAKLFKVPK